MANKSKEEMIEEIHKDTGMKKEVILDTAIREYYSELYD